MTGGVVSRLPPSVLMGKVAAEGRLRRSSELLDQDSKEEASNQKVFLNSNGAKRLKACIKHEQQQQS
jgi:hypothetical protein